MKVFFLHTIATILFTILVIFYPEVFINPGELIEGHQEIQKECLSCHSPFQGVATQKCTSCHEPEKIGRVTVSGAALPPKNNILFHQNLSDMNCLGCHSDHGGRDARGATKTFSHRLLKKSLQRDCLSCHRNQRPDDTLHPRVGENCGDCHQTTGWKPALFDHTALPGEFTKACAACHQKDRPGDQLHRQIKVACWECHTTIGWKPATFEHAQYFRFDRHHPPDCMSCHTNAQNFSQYTCYSCHEHSPAKMAREHREEGIYDFENCVQCHRSGDEDEAKRLWRKQRPSQKGKRYERHDDDDDDKDDDDDD